MSLIEGLKEVPKEPRRVGWLGLGAASAVAIKLARPDVIAYCDTGAEHPDNARFLTACEQWFGQRVEILKSDEYADTWAVWERRRFLAGISGAPCTAALKVEPRLAFQRPDDVHIFGYTADRSDMERATRLRENFFELTIKTPLIERGIRKDACLAMLGGAGIEIPMMYKLGFHNNNCIPCVKATSPAYWALIRLHFPEKFDRMVRLSRELDVRLCRIKDERRFIDEIPLDHPVTNPISPACDLLCHIASRDLESA